MFEQGSDHQRTRRGKLANVVRTMLLAGLLSPSLGCLGCAGFWDEVTDRNFEFSSLYTKPNPFVVLNESNDGTKRAKALRALHEPSQNGGSPADQETVVKILITAAVSEHTAVARMAAIEALGKFKDPRAATHLTEAFYNSGSFPAEMATRIQCQAVAAMGETGNPSAIPLLVRVVKGASGEGSELEKQQVMDVRIAAASALGHFHDARVTEALCHILQNDKDVALCDCAFESLQACTGRKLPPDFHNWDELLHAPNVQGAVASGQQGPAVKLMGWFQGR